MREPGLASTSSTSMSPHPRMPEVALVGSSGNFSDTLVRATGHHLPELTLVHYPSVEDLAALPPAMTRWLRLLLIDDVTLADAPDTLLQDLNCPQSTVIALAFMDPDIAADLYDARDRLPAIHSFIPLDVRLDVWLSLVRLVLHGGRYVPEELMARHRDPRSPASPPGAAAVSPRPNCELIRGLTQRQYKVLELVAAGLPNKVIATRLGVSDHTVKLHIHNIIAKLGVTNRTEAAARFYDNPQ